MLFRSQSLRLPCLLGALSLFQIQSCFNVSLSAFLWRRRADRWASTRETRRDKVRKRWYYLLLYVLHRADPELWWKATPFWSSKSPHESHWASPFLSFCISYSHSLSLSHSLWDAACLRDSLSLSLCFFVDFTCTCLGTLSATWDVAERNEVHLSLFPHLYTLPATLPCISCCVLLLASVFLSVCAWLLGLITVFHMLYNLIRLHKWVACLWALHLPRFKELHASETKTQGSVAFDMLLLWQTLSQMLLLCFLCLKRRKHTLGRHI